MKKIFYVLLVLFPLVGCLRSETEIPQTDDRIVFRTATLETRASSYVPDNKAGDVITTMGVYASTTGSSSYNQESHSINFIDNLKVSRADVSSPWDYSTPKYWPEGNTSFFAYAPYNALGAVISTGRGVPVIDFSVQDKQSEQVDLLVAKPVYDRTKTNSAVTMQMQHALTKIGFSALLSHSTDQIDQINWVKITQVELSGVYARGKHVMNADQPEWTELQNLKSVDNHFIANVDDGLREVLLTTDYQQINTDAGYLLMIPQSLKGVREGVYAKIKIHIVAEMKSGTTEVLFGEPLEFMLESTDIDWKDGEAVNYTVNIDLSDLTAKKSTIQAKVVDWNEMNSSTETLQRELNVTRVWAKVWDASLTRVFFHSNQPYVWIENSEIYNNATDDSLGDRITNVGQDKVNNYFRDLAYTWDLAQAGSLDSKYANYNNVSNFSYNPDTGEGYFDVLNLVSAESRGNVDNSYHVYLCASNEKYIDRPLRRSIRLNTLIRPDWPAPSGVTTPYVGTFHRGDQRGERIITWRNTGYWTAVVMPIPSEDESGTQYHDYDHVLIDRNISPSLEADILYTDNPGDAEDYKVSEWNSSLGGESIFNGKKYRWVGSVDKVYLRVGWDNYAPGAPFTPTPGKANLPNGASKRNRYAVIHIYNRKYDGTWNPATTTPVSVLYIRQGELDDYVMRPTDTYSGLRRDYACRFSPYNLSDPLRGDGGLDISDHNHIGERGADFADYPTQPGYLFCYDQTTRAFNPYNPNNITKQGISGWPQSKGDKTAPPETCPPGYRRPSEGDAYGIGADDAYYRYQYSEFGQSLFQTTSNRGKATSTQGFYADGFFDRRKIFQTGGAYINVENAVGGYKRGEIGYYGSLYFNPKSLASLFFTHSGRRAGQGTDTNGIAGQLINMGQVGLYWSSTSSDQAPSYAWGLDFWDVGSYSSAFEMYKSSKTRAHSIRCVVDNTAVK